MTDRQFKEVHEQLPDGTKVLRAYRALEGDIRVIVRLPGEERETRYTVRFEGDYPHIRHMP